MTPMDPELRRTWLFGPGADAAAHAAMLASPADALIADLEDFTPPQRRPQARENISPLLASWSAAGKLAVVRINDLATDGLVDLQAAMPGRPHVVAYPMAASAAQMSALDETITAMENTLGIALGSTEIMPVCETALGVVDVRSIVAGSARIRCALLGAEDLASDLCAERQADANELDYARRRFILECRAARVEPIDAPYTFSDAEGAFKEAHYSRRLGYRSKSLVRPDHAQSINAALTPSDEDVRRASAMVTAFEAARARARTVRLSMGYGWKCPPTATPCALWSGPGDWPLDTPSAI